MILEGVVLETWPRAPAPDSPHPQRGPGQAPCRPAAVLVEGGGAWTVTLTPRLQGEVWGEGTEEAPSPRAAAGARPVPADDTPPRLSAAADGSRGC